MKTFTKVLLLAAIIILNLQLETSNCHAQYVNIPDAQFVSWLNTNGYASCMSGNKLDTNCTAVLKATIMNLSGSNTANLTGIQYFKNLDSLFDEGGSLTYIPAFPPKLTYIDLYHNPLVSLPALPPALLFLECYQDSLTSLPTLPSKLINLICSSNKLTELPVLPSTLTSLQCDFNQITTLPVLPVVLTTLQCNNNHIINLPSALPPGLFVLFCGNNYLTNLPPLPPTLQLFACQSNFLSYIPALPFDMGLLDVGNNPNVTCLPHIEQINSDIADNFDISGTSIRCLDGVITHPSQSSLPAIDTMPLCTGAFNPNYCPAYIPDSNFVLWLNNNGYASCMNGHYLDVLCPAIASADSIDCSNSNIADLTGIQFFVNVTYLNCSQNALTTIAPLPPALTTLLCSAQGSSVYLAGYLQGGIDSLPSTLQYLDCNSNSLSTLPTLPAPLWFINCGGNPLSCLPTLPPNLVYINTNGTLVECVPNNPNGASSLPVCSSVNYQAAISATHTSICTGTSVTFTYTAGKSNVLSYQWKKNNVVVGGDSAQYVSSTLLNGDVINCTVTGNVCSTPSTNTSNSITMAVGNPTDTASVTISTPIDTICGGSYVTFTASPVNGGANPTYSWRFNGEVQSGATYSTITTAYLPYGTPTVVCIMTSNIVCVVNSPATSNAIDMTVITPEYAYVSISANPSDTICQGTSVTFTAKPVNSGVPTYDWKLNGSTAGTNQDTYTSSALNNGDVISCVITSSLACATNSPSASNDITMKVNSCNPATSIAVHIYQDNNSNCTQDGSEPSVNNVKVNIYKGALLVQQGYVFGTDTFTIDTGTYTLAVDTAALPYGFTCPAGGDTTITVSSSNPSPTINFGLQCKPGFDIGVWSIVKSSFLFPGDTASVAITAGDINKVAFGTACNTNAVSGTLVVLISGPADYDGVANGASTPAYTSNDSLVYNVADFSAPGNFAFKMVTAPGAALGQQVCIDAHVTLNSPGDRDTMNNSLSQCFVVNNSFDPNYKEVGPPGSIQTPYTGWLTYTVHFQNTGNAAAQKIVVRDTLDANLAPGTFQLLNYSAQPQVQISGHYVTFTFAGINLPDSITSPDGSMGYVEYRIQPISNLSGGQSVSNTASIYFDFNNPVRTNTITSSFNLATGVNKLEVGGLKLEVYPNPANDVVNIVLSQPCENCIMTLTDVTGRAIMQTPLNGMNTTLDLSSVSAGVYFVRVSNEQGTMTKKIVKQ